MPLDLKGQQRFLNFSAHPAIGAVQKKRPGKLHGDGAGAFHDAMRDNILPGRAGHAREIHAPMLFEVLILGGQNGILQDLRELFVGEKHAALQGEVADNLAVVRVEFGDNVGLKILERANLREIAGINETAGLPGAPTAIEPSSSSMKATRPTTLRPRKRSVIGGSSTMGVSF